RERDALLDLEGLGALSLQVGDEALELRLLLVLLRRLRGAVVLRARLLGEHLRLVAEPVVLVERGGRVLVAALRDRGEPFLEASARGRLEVGATIVHELLRVARLLVGLLLLGLLLLPLGPILLALLLGRLGSGLLAVA